MNLAVEKTIQALLKEKIVALEDHLQANVLSYYGPIIDGNESQLRADIETLMATNDKKYNKIYIILTTYGGSATAVERFVNIIRYHYKEVNFIVPDYAYSAGTIWCMSGDNILMDYYSVLGPIDPQVQNKEGKWVPALGYLDKINELLDKESNGGLTRAELIILKDQDLGELRAYEQAKAHTIDLLKSWLVKYKFKNWKTHATDPKLLGQKVTGLQKVKRAEDIAAKLSDNNRWKSHSRPINIETLEKDLRLKIDDYSQNEVRNQLITDYYDLLSDFAQNTPGDIFVQTRETF